MVRGVKQVEIDVQDQQRALDFWTTKIGFEVARDEPYGAERWLEVQAPDGVTLVLALRRGAEPSGADELPTSNVFFYCDDLASTYEALSRSGVSFPQPPVEQPWGWWSMFEDDEGNRFALTPRS